MLELLEAVLDHVVGKPVLNLGMVGRQHLRVLGVGRGLYPDQLALCIALHVEHGVSL
ncbi:hypothetical protein D3C77_783920 [compost metagenome]